MTLEDSSDFLKVRTRKFALATIRLCENLKVGKTSDIISRQFLRCSTSVGANYRASCRGRSKPDFIFKLGIVEEEIDESIYWLELFIDTNLLSREKGELAIREAEEILSMVVASIKTSRAKTK